jgi:hypothetical protein
MERAVSRALTQPTLRRRQCPSAGPLSDRALFRREREREEREDGETEFEGVT